MPSILFFNIPIYSLKEVVKDPSVKPKLQCLMVDPSFSMVTVQSEDSGIVWETASSRCSTPWASEGSSPSESYSLESSGAQGKITVIMDEDKIVRKRKKTGRSKLGDRFKRPSSRMAAYGTERPAMAEVSVPNVRPENDEEAELKVNKDQELFSLISEGYEILNIVVPSKLPTVDEEEASDLVDNLSYLQDTPKIKSKSKPAPAPAGEDYQGIIEVQQIVNGENEHADKDEEPLLKHAKKEGPDEDYLDKFKLVDSHVPSELPSTAGVPEDKNIIQEPEQVTPPEESKSKPSASNIEDSFVIITDEEISSEHMDEVFYANIGSMAEETHKGDDSDGGMTDEPKSLKESGSALFGSQETILIPVYLPEGPPKIIDPVLLEEPRAMSFLYTDLYDEAMGSRRRDDDHSDVESTVSEKSYKKRFSDDDEEDEGYLEKFILKDETEAVEDTPEVPDDTLEGERIIWPQTKFELTGCLKRVEEPDDSEGERTAIAATEEMKENEKPQLVNAGKQEEVSQESVTEAADGSKTEQEKAGDGKVCVGDHCEPCDAGKIISESSVLNVIQKDEISLLLEEKVEAVGEIRKDEKAKNSNEMEAMEISETILEKSSDLLHEVEQALSEAMKEPVTSQDSKPFSPEVVSENIATATIVEQPSLEKVEEISEKHSDIKVFEEPLNQTIEAKKSDEVISEEVTAGITGQVEVKEANISKEEPGVHLTKSGIVTAPEATENSKVSVISVEPLRTDSVSHVPDEITGGIEELKIDTFSQEKEKATVPFEAEDVSKSLLELETKDLKQDVTEEEMVTETSSGKDSAAIVEAERPQVEPPGVEVVTVEDEAVRVEEVTTENQKERELVEKQGEIPEVEKSMAKEKTVKDDHLISVIRDTINATEPQLSVESPQSEIQEQEAAIQEPTVHLVSQGDLKVSETVEPNRTVETSEVVELHHEKSPVLQASVEVTSTLTELEKVKESQQPTETERKLVEKTQVLTEELLEVHKTTEEKSEASDEITSMLQVNANIISEVHESKEIEHKTSTSSEKSQAVTVALFPGKIETIEFSIGNREKLDGATIEVKKHVEEQAQKKPKKEAQVPIIEVILGKASLAPGKATEKQLPTSKTEVPLVASEQNDSEETVTRTAALVTGVQKDTKQDVSLDSILLQTEVESNEQAVQEPVKAADAEKAAELERVEPEVKETQALDKPKTEVDLVPGTLKEESEVPAESSDQKAVSQDDTEAVVVVSKPGTVKTATPVSGKIVSDAEIPSDKTQASEAEVMTEENQSSDKSVSVMETEIPSVETLDEVLKFEVSEQIIASVVEEIPSVETQAPEAVIVEMEALDKTVSNSVRESPVTETQGPEVINMDEVSVKMAEGVVAEIPAVKSADEVLIVESEVSSKTISSVVAEIPTAETLISEVIIEENQGSDKPVRDIAAEIPSVETVDEVLPVENKVSEQVIASVVTEIPSVESQGPQAVSAETKVSEETVSDVAAERLPIKTPSLEAMTLENKTVIDVISGIPSVETLNKEVLTAEDKLACQIDVVADSPSVETTSSEMIIEEAKISDQIVDDVTKIPSVETTDKALFVDKVSDVIKTLPEVETEGLRHDATEQEVVTETLLDKISAIIVEAEMPSFETPGVVTKEDTAVRTPSPSATPALVKVEEVTTEDQKAEPVEEKIEELEGLVFSPLRSFSPQEDLSVLPEPEPFKGPEYRDETAEEFGYEMVTRQEVREYVGMEAEVIPEREAEDECIEEEETSKAFEEEEAAEDVLEADYEFIEESESIVLSEEDQAKMQALDAFCLVCQCPVLMMEEHQNHEMCSLDKAFEVLKVSIVVIIMNNMSL